ncbi:MAG: hypothetical protein HC918_12970 [Oscillatoriales cyanobacterium SM2_1_8]|nr:hypothetical protein [Oscillatoriales cyanobacterium SM2_1_8]
MGPTDRLDAEVFATEAQQQCFAAIAAALMAAGRWPRRPAVRSPILTLNQDETTVAIEVQPYGSTESWVAVWSYLVTGCPLSADLLLFLLRENFNVRFGVFAIAGVGDVVFRARLLGSSCTVDKLLAVVNEVGAVTTQWDRVIAEHWGGERAAERMCYPDWVPVMAAPAPPWRQGG